MKNAMIAQLSDGLTLRQGRPDDIDKLVALYAECLRHNDQPDIRAAAWARDVFRYHPTIRPADFTVVENGEGVIVSSLLLISQRWAYEGIEFGVGRPELVATLPGYRDRGLVRRQFELMHEWSAERGEMVQAITGIPYYYRQFGYEMTVTLGGARMGPRSGVPPLKPGETEPFSFRPATLDDLLFLKQLHEYGQRRYPMMVLRDEALWRHDLGTRDPEEMYAPDMVVIESAEGRRAGWLMVLPFLWDAPGGGKASVAGFWEMAPGESWLVAGPSLARYLLAHGDALAEREGKECTTIQLQLGAQHPGYDVLPEVFSRARSPYAWYVRVPDIGGFLRHIAPALEKRVAGSLAVGHTGTIKTSFYRTGLRLVFEGGRLVTVEPWKPTPADGGDIAFPGLTFLQLLFGYRTLAELQYAFPDLRVNNDAARVVFEAMFPKGTCDLWGVE